jgi:predicted transcriptional regulator
MVIMAAKSRMLMERESRRNESEIRVEILRALLTNGPLVPTRIMLKVNTNWYYVMRSLDRLLKTGALTKAQENAYSITSLGVAALCRYDEVMQVIG